jgi:hypothetical protein
MSSPTRTGQTAATTPIERQGPFALPPATRRVGDAALSGADSEVSLADIRLWLGGACAALSVIGLIAGTLVLD